MSSATEERKLCGACHQRKPAAAFSNSAWDKSDDNARVCRKCREYDAALTENRPAALADTGVELGSKIVHTDKDFLGATFPCAICRGFGHGLSDSTLNEPCGLCLATGRVVECTLCAGKGKLPIHDQKPDAAAAAAAAESAPPVLALCPRCMSIGETPPTALVDAATPRFVPLTKDELAARAAQIAQDRFDATPEGRVAAQHRAVCTALGWPVDWATRSWTWKELFALARPQQPVPVPVTEVPRVHLGESYTSRNYDRIAEGLDVGQMVIQIEHQFYFHADGFYTRYSYWRSESMDQSGAERDVGVFAALPDNLVLPSNHPSDKRHFWGLVVKKWLVDEKYGNDPLSAESIVKGPQIPSGRVELLNLSAMLRDNVQAINVIQTDRRPIVYTESEKQNPLRALLQGDFPLGKAGVA